MNKALTYFVAFILLTTASHKVTGQMGTNIVSNPSFNLVSSCPFTGPMDGFEGGYNEEYYNWLPKRVHIYDSNNILIDIVDSGITQFGSPNPFHACNGYYSENCAPIDLDGGGGVGMGIHYNTFLPFREFSAIKLTNPLLPFQNYCISFYIANCSSPVGTGSADAYFLNKQMIAFGPDIFLWPDNSQDDYRSYLSIGLQNETIFMDTSVWHKIQGNYQANGSEEYLFLGWAEPTSNISIFIVDDVPGVNYGAAYNLFDSISVVECDQMGMNIDNLEVPNVITPNNDGTNDFWTLNDGEAIPNNICVEIYNIWGELVYHSSPYNNEWRGQSQCGTNLSEGVYYYVIHMPIDQEKSGTVNIFR